MPRPSESYPRGFDDLAVSAAFGFLLFLIATALGAGLIWGISRLF
jgi:hypothetical protein